MNVGLLRWLAARVSKDAPLFGPPLPPYARRDRHGRVYRYRSWWNADVTLHRISAVQLDGAQLPRLTINDDLADDFEIPNGLLTK